MTKKIGGDLLTGKVEANMRQDSSTALVSRMAQYFRSRERSQSEPASFDIGRIASEIQALQQQDRLDPFCLKGYAIKN